MQNIKKKAWDQFFSFMYGTLYYVLRPMKLQWAFCHYLVLRFENFWIQIISGGLSPSRGQQAQGL
jgi:hypothetical protein